MIHNFSFTTYLSYTSIFRLFVHYATSAFSYFTWRKKTLSFLFVPLHNWVIKKKGAPSSFSPKQNPNHTFRSRSFVLNLCHILFRKCVCQICIKLLINFSPSSPLKFVPSKQFPVAYDCKYSINLNPFWNLCLSIFTSVSFQVFFVGHNLWTTQVKSNLDLFNLLKIRVSRLFHGQSLDKKSNKSTLSLAVRRPSKKTCEESSFLVIQ